MTTLLERPPVGVEPAPAPPQAATPTKNRRMWPRYVVVGVLAGAVGLGAGYAAGYVSRDSEVATLKARSTTTMAPLEQNTPHDVAARRQLALERALAPLQQNTPHDVAARTGG